MVLKCASWIYDARREEYGASLQSLYELRDDLQAHDGTQLEVPVELLRCVHGWSLLF